MAVHHNQHNCKHVNNLKSNISLPCNVSAQKVIFRGEIIAAEK